MCLKCNGTYTQTLSTTVPVCERGSQRAYQLLEGCDVSGLQQHVFEPTRVRTT